ncbi:MAG TPA: ABC transporter ATP-binding protein [Rhodospirillales bacterium]|nr:ABC transporter ATP-binding protein [Rhodospirillales bacterium]
MALLEVKDLVVDFATRAGKARVLDHVSLSVEPGEILGIVGESGCGKSMTALSILGLVPSPPGNVSGGAVYLDDENLIEASEARMRQIRGKDISMIFQEPMTSLNPVFSVGEQIAEGLRLHESISSARARTKAIEMIRAVGIPEPELRSKNYPHQMSGGMRQRIMIAMALACGPRVLIADEPTTALDVTVQAQIFDLLKALQQQNNTAIILITHDMGVIAQLCDHVAVMYAGRVIETSTTETILSAPRHPYTQGLIACVPHLEENPGDERKPLMEIEGVVPPLTELGAGCAFAPRCARHMPVCDDQKPVMTDYGPSHSVACLALADGDAP